MKVRLRIDATDRTDLLPRTGWTLDDYEGKSIPTLNLTLEDRAASVAQEALEFRDLILDNPDTAVRYFNGLVTQVDSSPLEGIGRKHAIICQGYSWLLERYLHTAMYEGKTDKEIIADAFANCNNGGGLAEINSATYVVASRIIEKFKMNNMTLRAMLDALAEITGCLWYIDWSKNLVYRSPAAAVAPFALSDVPDSVLTYPYQGLTRTKDFTGLLTGVLIRGGFYLAGADTYYFSGDGNSTLIPLGAVRTGPTTAQTLPDVWKNIGSDAVPNWSAQTVGDADKGQTTASYNCIFSHINASLEFATAPPNLVKSIKVYGRKWQVLSFLVPDAAAKAAAGGRDLIIIYNDEDITTEEQATDKAMGILREKSAGRDKVTLKCDTDGLRSGQLIHITNAKLGIDKDYSIRRVTIRFLGAALASYDLTLTNPTRLAPDAIDMLAAGWRASMPKIEPREEMLLISLSYTEPVLALVEALLTPTGTVKTYRVSPNIISDWRCDEGQGSTLRDWQGRNDLTLYNSPTWEQGKRSYALRLNGTNQYGKKATASGLPGTAFTICAWVKLDVLKDYNVILVHDWGLAGGWILFVDVDGKVKMGIHDGVNAYYAEKTGVSALSWAFVAGSYDGANIYASVNAVNGSAQALVQALDTVGDVYLGQNGGGGEYLDGLVDEVLLFPAALTETQLGRIRDYYYARAHFVKVAA